MERIRLERSHRRRKPRPEVLPLDPRDPDIVRAKELLAKTRPPRPRAV